MLEFKILEEFKPNPKITELIKNYTYKNISYYSYYTWIQSKWNQ